MSLIRNAFKRLHYPADVIAQCVRWYLAYTLSLRNLEEMMSERGIAVDHATLSRWVHRRVPLIVKRYRRSKPDVGRRWRMNETYIKIKGQWRYLYRAVDSDGNTVDFLLTACRNKKAALRFFKKAIGQHAQPAVVTMDKSGANKAAVDALSQGNMKQGTQWEDYVGTQLPAGSRLPPRFEVFDYHDMKTDLAVSVKTLDIQTLPKLNKPNDIYYSIKGNIDKTVRFEGDTVKVFFLTPDIISRKEIRLAVPINTNARQWSEVNRAIRKLVWGTEILVRLDRFLTDKDTQMIDLAK